MQFSTLKIEFPSIQINEKAQSFLTIKNNTKMNYNIEIFLPFFEVCGLKITPLVASIAAEKSTEVVIEYESFFKRLSAYTLADLKTKYEQDPNKNFGIRLKKKQDEDKKLLEDQRLKEEEAQKLGASKQQKKGPEKKEPPAKEPEKKANLLDLKKTGKLNKQQEKELEEELKKQQELDKLKEEEEKQRKLEIEKHFDVQKELTNLGGKFIEFNAPEDPSYSQHYDWLIPCYFAPKKEGILGDPNVRFINQNTEMNNLKGHLFTIMHCFCHKKSNYNKRHNRLW